MVILRIEHKVADYLGWKRAFDSDPINRKESGVKRYRIFRQADDDTVVVIDLEFDNMEQAEKAEAALQKVFGMIEGKVIFGVQTKIFTLAEEVEI
ncbi:MAG: hypothetical protein AB7H80_09615 [Candidatus Kapaibacterium sp.]